MPASCQSLAAEAHPRLSEQVSEILSDQNGRIYLSSDRGVLRITPSAGGSLKNVRLEMFDTEDGLPGLSVTRASFRDHHGRIWSGSASGIAIFDPSSEPRHGTPAPAPLRIERCLVEGRERPPAAGLDLRDRESRLEVEYSLLRYRREHEIRFRTQLFEEVLSLADHALYLAKREGRNQAVGVLPGVAAAEEVAERILREDAPLLSLEAMQVELVWAPGPPVAPDDRTSTLRSA